MTIPTKADVLRKLKMNATELANLFSITRQAVDQWPVDGPLTANRWRELRYELRPDVFNKGKTR